MMKSYLEVSKELFERRDRYLLEKARRRKRRIRGISVLGTAAAFLILLRLTVFAPAPIPKGMLSESKPRGEEIALGGGEDVEGAKEEASEKNYGNDADLTDGASEEILQWNEDFRESEAKIDPKIREEDAVRLHISEFYGKVFPEVPTDLSLQTKEDLLLLETENGPDGEVTVYRREKSGEVYWSQQNFFYSNPTGSRTLEVAVARGGLPFSCEALLDRTPLVSQIKGEEVELFRRKDKLHAHFLREDTGFRIRSQGLDEEEFVDAVRSLMP